MYFLHGADYNPDQWFDSPDLLEKDIELMKKAHCNVVSLAMFSWASLEPEEGIYHLDWLEIIINNLYQNGIYTILSTPSGARPHWLASKYPEVLRVEANRTRNLFGGRHNHCYTSPLYRKKVGAINEKLATRFGHHPGVILWHLSNEYGGECHCPLCQEAFRDWLKAKYQTLDALNKAWWTTFWSHTYTSWEQIESPAPHGENALHGLNLDWKRFVSHQTLDFIKWERDRLKPFAPHIPVTTNLMYYYNTLNYFDFKDELDILSWDSYPVWHRYDTSDETIAADTAMFHDIIRSIKQAPFLLMESTPSQTNWQNVSKLKRPGMHMLSSLQAIAHGSQSVQYFQWRKSRGASEKFHGAVIDHYGKEDTRVFKEVSELGKRLEELKPIATSKVNAQVAMLYDWENKWALEDAQGPRNIGMHYKETIQDHYKAFWRLGIPVDFVDMSCDLTGYKVFVAPMMYMLRHNFHTKIRDFVAAGGTFIGTYWSGVVDENDLCYLGETPHGLTDVLGIRTEEIDSLFDGEHNSSSTTLVYDLCELAHVTTAKVLMTYNEDFYQGKPTLTVNSFGKGQAYYMATRFEEGFYDNFYNQLTKKLNLYSLLPYKLPKGVIVSSRQDDTHHYLFLQNFTNTKQEIPPLGASYEALSSCKSIHEAFHLEAYEVLTLKVPV